MDFPYIGMIESSDRVSYFQTGTLPEGVRTAGAYLRGEKKEACVVLDNSHFADHRIDLTKSDITPGNTVYFFFNILCSRDTDCFFYIHTKLNIRIFRNERFFSVSRTKTGIAYTIRLTAGENRICLEYPHAVRGHVLTFWLNSFQNERKNRYLSVLDGTANRLQPFCLYSEMHRERGKFCLDFLPLPEDSLGFSGTVTAELFAYPSGKRLFSSCFPLGGAGHWECDLASEKLREKMSCIQMICRCTWPGHPPYQLETNFPVAEPAEYYDGLTEEIRALRQKNPGLQAGCVLDFWSEELAACRPEAPEVFRIFTDSRQAFAWVKDGCPPEKIREPGCHRIYFYSRLDGMPISYSIRIPRGYTEKKQYPFVAFFSINRYDDYSTKPVM